VLLQIILNLNLTFQIDLYIELIVKSNQNNKSVLSEQDARNVFKLCQYENLHKVFQQSFQEQSIVNSVSHPEYFYIQRWIVRLNDFLDGEADADVLQDLKNVSKNLEVIRFYFINL
jgi:hypothetical protein